MMAFLRKFEVWVFLFFLVVVNAIFVSAVVKGILPDSVYRYGRFVLLGTVLFGLVFLLNGPRGVWEVCKPIFDWRRPWYFYLAVSSWTAIICLSVLMIKGLITGRMLTWHDLIPGLKVVCNPISVKLILVSSIVGEMVWIGYALRKLANHHSHYVSAVIVGLFWTLWWLPMWFYNYGIIGNLPLPALLINQIGVALMCAFVYFHFRSGMMVLVMQVVFNTTILILPVTPDIGGVPTYWAFAITYFVLATLLFMRFGPSITQRKSLQSEAMMKERRQKLEIEF